MAVCSAQDHYENIYAVVRGMKSFMLLPPCDAYRLRIVPYPMANYQHNPSGQLDLVPVGRGEVLLSSTTALLNLCPYLQRSAVAHPTCWQQGGQSPHPCKMCMQGVPWTALDPFPHTKQDLDNSKSEYPDYWDADLPPPLYVEVHAGEVLYLPSLWFHHVKQAMAGAEAVIAVNYWYDMAYDCRYAYTRAMDSLARL